MFKGYSKDGVLCSTPVVGDVTSDSGAPPSIVAESNPRPICVWPIHIYGWWICMYLIPFSSQFGHRPFHAWQDELFVPKLRDLFRDAHDRRGGRERLDESVRRIRFGHLALHAEICESVIYYIGILVRDESISQGTVKPCWGKRLAQILQQRRFGRIGRTILAAGHPGSKTSRIQSLVRQQIGQAPVSNHIQLGTRSSVSFVEDRRWIEPLLSKGKKSKLTLRYRKMFPKRKRVRSRLCVSHSVFPDCL